jgi:hypothetical protein
VRLEQLGQLRLPCVCVSHLPPPPRSSSPVRSLNFTFLNPVRNIGVNTQLTSGRKKYFKHPTWNGIDKEGVSNLGAWPSKQIINHCQSWSNLKVEWVEFLLRSREISGSNLGPPETDYHWFPRCLPTNSGIVPQARSFPSTSFLIHYWLIIPLFYYTQIFSLVSLFWKNKSRLILSPCCLCVFISPYKFLIAEPIFMKLGMYIMAPEPISTAYAIYFSHQSVCMCIPAIVARQRLVYRWQLSLMRLEICHIFLKETW